MDYLYFEGQDYVIILFVYLIFKVYIESTTLVYMHQSNYQEHQQQHLDFNNHRYITNLCRNGPIPLSRHKPTDILCTILFLLTFLAFLITFLINYLHYLKQPDPNINYDPKNLPFFDTIAYMLHFNIVNQLGTILLLFAIAFVLLIMAVAVPAIIGYFIILLSYAFLLGMIYLEVFAKWGKVYTKAEWDNWKWEAQEISLDVFRIMLIVFTVVSIVILTILICSRFSKLKHLGSLMKVSSHVLKKNIPMLPIVMIVNILINAGVWIGMSFVCWKLMVIRYEIKDIPIPIWINYVLLAVFWVWVHGFQISLSDYICQSWVIHWYYREILQIENDQDSSKNWKSGIFKKLLKYHLGTIICGSFLPYLPEYLLKKISKTTITPNTPNTPINSTPFIFRLNRYYHIENILECLNFPTSTNQLFYLRKRIKNTIPQIYMLGHFIEDILKINFIMVVIFGLFYLGFMQEQLLNPFSAQLTQFQFFGFFLLVGLGLALEVATNISHLFGMLNDTAVIVYAVDSEIERVYYGNNSARAVPKQLLQHFIPLFTKNIKTTASPENQELRKQNNEYNDQFSELQKWQKQGVLYRYSALNSNRFTGAQANFYEEINNPYRDG